VLDPELDESILDLGFVRSLQLRSGHAEVVLRLPTSWCAVNFTYLMAEDVRRALLTVEGIHQATIRLGDHRAAEEIEAAVNHGQPFAEAFPGDRAESLSALRLTFCARASSFDKSAYWRDLRGAGCSPAAICGLRLGEVSTQDDAVVVRQPDCTSVECGSAAILRRYVVERWAELDLDCSPTPR
jgi:metal-sulfur cluster biosynthetic enzyme